MKRILGTVGFVMLGIGVAGLLVASFAGTVVGSIGPCHGAAACIATTDVLLGMVMMSIALGLPFGGWVGYRVSRMVFCRVGPRLKPFPPTQTQKIASHANW